MDLQLSAQPAKPWTRTHTLRKWGLPLVVLFVIFEYTIMSDWTRPRPRPPAPAPAELQYRTAEPFKTFIRIPKLTPSDRRVLHGIYAQIAAKQVRGIAEKSDALAQLGAIIQRQLSELEVVPHCNSTVTLFCGYGGGTGFASQLLHRMICLMLSYVFGVPLIHDESAWSYKKPLSAVFERVGSSCSLSVNHTLRVIAYEHYSTEFLSGDAALAQLAAERGCTTLANCTFIEYPFRQGLSVPREVEELVALLHEDSFMWWLGQFTKYMIRLKQGANTTEYVHSWRHRLFPPQLTRPVIGMHVRRTDKVSEAKLYKTAQYFEVAAEILRNLSLTRASVFIASDAADQVLEEARNLNLNLTSQFSIIGIEGQPTTRNQSERVNALDEIVRDVFLLYEECDYVVCTLSSGICQLLLQLFSAKYPDGPSRVKSLDLQYEETIGRWWTKAVFPI